jgi:hypothetical protein
MLKQGPVGAGRGPFITTGLRMGEGTGRMDWFEELPPVYLSDGAVVSDPCLRTTLRMQRKKYTPDRLCQHVGRHTRVSAHLKEAVHVWNQSPGLLTAWPMEGDGVGTPKLVVGQPLSRLRDHDELGSQHDPI